VKLYRVVEEALEAPAQFLRLETKHRKEYWQKARSPVKFPVTL